MRLIKKVTCVFFILIFITASSYSYNIETPDQADNKTQQENNAKDEVFFQFNKLITVVSTIFVSYIDSIALEDLVVNSIEGVVSKLDAHSSYISKEDYKIMSENMAGKFAGIGVTFTVENNSIIIKGVNKNGPSDKVGLMLEDVIVSVDGIDVTAYNLVNILKKIRGKEGDSVIIRILRNGIERLEFLITREIIKTKLVTYSLLDEAYGYVRLKRFGNNSYLETLNAINDLNVQAGGEISGLIFDLRNNPGGFLTQAIYIVDMFIDEGTIVYTQGNSADSNMLKVASKKTIKGDYPIVILVDSRSASASEIVAGALQDHGAAIVLGTRTFGKGSVQQFYSLGDGSFLNLTIARYYTPNGRSIQARGIVPDIIITNPITSKKDSHKILRELDIARHLKKEGNSSIIKYVNNNREAALLPMSKFNKDRQVKAALKVLKGTLSPHSWEEK